MLIIAATYTEIAPIIEKLDMKQIEKKPFSIYANQKHRIVISGIGKIKAAAALSYALVQKREEVCNIGYAAGESIGSLFAIKKVIDIDSDKVFHIDTPPILPKTSCTTFSKPVHIKQKTLADMEASAIVETAKLFKTPVYIIKLVSDNFEPETVQEKSLFTTNQIDRLLSLLSLQS
ncbi:MULTISPECIES: hypothetical protein [unclassified Nitratiruptor]|uniref:5'-methylthioadenosine/S-adenosylhomocysteine nucleosidase family protein n=1 Tax=unclassified Nitratiruptor TaxID=2624044 RepID=UPI001915DC1E|nr:MULTISPECIES: hypothetical protein [unclassified Nitratiruptor]BCD60233.1 hypothetical protein NitYY0810_C0998 [Nitratiruptor sp. YY08-10]BCD64278.1 hypothetical protein NitYY0814_C1123 [Nitratiruptor sp. YY08-14]